MGKRIPLCAFLMLALIAVVSFIIVYMVIHHHKPCKDGKCVVKIDLGHLSGRERVSTLNNKTYYSFQRIPYAKPPVGPLRFKDPEPIEHWHTVIDATKQSDSCIQRGKSRILGDVVGSEDCLYLNIYTTQFPDHDVTLHPVMVYFHGGGFNYGSSDEYIYGADFLVEREVVLITLNYRLGALGFLSLNNEEIPGNAGLKDQRLALNWIKEHISHFGGDPNNVIIFGNSAGAASVQYHMLSPSSAGLFHKAIMQSGSVFNPWAFDEDAVGRAHRLAKELGFTGDNDKELTDFFQKQSAVNIVHFQEKSKTPEEAKKCFSVPFMPSVEAFKSESSFLTDHPHTLFENNQYRHVPTIIGTVTNEGLITLTRSDFMIYFNGSDFEKFVPLDLHLDHNGLQFHTVVQSIKEFYFHDNSLTLDNLNEYYKICGDLEFNIGLQKSIDYFIKHSEPQTFVYKFTYEGALNFNKQFLQNKWPSLKLPTGPTHTDELTYIFNTIATGNITNFVNELKLIDQMASMWTTFASSQSPTEEWQPYREGAPSYLDIGLNISSVPGSLLADDKQKFWNNIYDLVVLDG